jgi:hypothetical protein
VGATNSSNPKLRLGDLDIDGIEAEVIMGFGSLRTASRRPT